MTHSETEPHFLLRGSTHGLPHHTWTTDNPDVVATRLCDIDAEPGSYQTTDPAGNPTSSLIVIQPNVGHSAEIISLKLFLTTMKEKNLAFNFQPDNNRCTLVDNRIVQANFDRFNKPLVIKNYRSPFRESPINVGTITTDVSYIEKWAKLRDLGPVLFKKEPGSSGILLLKPTYDNRYPMRMSWATFGDRFQSSHLGLFLSEAPINSFHYAQCKIFPRWTITGPGQPIEFLPFHTPVGASPLETPTLHLPQ